LARAKENPIMNPDPMPNRSSLVPASATLPLERVDLHVEARGGLARVRLEQAFRNDHADPLAVTYVLPLPSDSAVAGYAFTVGDRRIEGEVDRVRAARERFNEAMAQGKTAALLEQDRSSLFTQELGNVPPGAAVTVAITIDQPLRWLEEGSWEWRFPLAAAPRYLGGPGRVEDAPRRAFNVAPALAPRASLLMAIDDALVAGRSPESPSHPLQVVGGRVMLGEGNRAELDRDLVVRWAVGMLAPSVHTHAEKTALPDAHALLAVVPPRPEAKCETVARDLILLLDTSGSMGGAPLDQARRVAGALVDGLGDGDSVELIAFSTSQHRFQKKAVPATRENRRAALEWLAGLRASGGTEMRDGILEALRPLRAGSQRQVVLVTDGLIGFEQEIVQAILEKLPPGSRVHTVGVGPSVNRSLTGPAARAGRGVEIVIGLQEDPERAAARIRARTEKPLVVDVTVQGSVLLESAPACIPDVYAGGPVLVSARVKAEGGELVVRGKTPRGRWEQRVHLSPRDGGGPFGGMLATLFGRQAVEDAEMRLAGGAPRAEIDARIEKLGLDYKIATRLTSWVAVDATPSVDPRAPTRREVIPQMLPHGLSVEGLGLRSRAMAAGVPAAEVAAALAAPLAGMRPRGKGGAPAPMTYSAAPKPPAEIGAVRRFRDRMFLGPGKEPPRREVARGRVVSSAGKELVLELAVVAEIRLDEAAVEGAIAVVWLDDGSRVRARIDVARSTRLAHLVPGQYARIVLILDKETARTAQRLTLEPDLGLDVPLA
jgi:Ca-activated chloride channel family protein